MLYLFICLSISLSRLAFASEGSCSLCERIRENNAKNPEPHYYYYEDYLKAKEQGLIQEKSPFQQQTNEDSEVEKPETTK